MMFFCRQLLAAIVTVTLVLPAASEARTIPANPATVTYDYDAFGNLLHSTGTTPNNYLFTGEQFDPDLGLYYNRARYLNTSSGRFWSMDSYEGDDLQPLSLHKYLYTNADPIDYVDRSGHEEASLAGQTFTVGQLTTLAAATLVVSLVYACVAYAALSGGQGFCGDPSRRQDDKITLWHYTEYPSLDAIRKDGFLRPSLEAVSSVYGQGQYFTDISPTQAGTVTKGQFLYAIYQFPFGWGDTDVGYLEFRISEKSVQRVADVYGSRFPGRGIYLRRSLLNLFFGANADAILVGVGQVVFLGN